ncbi:MAG: peptide ABC transporter substrate-binding protein [Deltaproteobacteria bacterium]|nr:peptide ABC transporter substrate-binding protein [Deltaproteobacteria bacterium]
MILAMLTSVCKRAPETAPSSRLVIGTAQEPDGLDPLFAQRASSQEAAALVIRDLAAYDERWSVVPDLAAAEPQRVSSSTGGATFRVELDESLAWSDLVKVTAEDVAFGFSVAANPRLGLAGPSTRSISSVRALSERWVEIRTSDPGLEIFVPRLLPVLPKHAYPPIPKEAVASFAGMGRNPVANGPYRLLAWTSGRSLTFERNPGWPGPRPELDQIELAVFASEDALELAVRSGRVDALGEASGLSVDRVLAASRTLEKTHVLELTESGVWLHLDVRLDDPVGKDVRFRRALDLAIDREALATLAYEGLATPSASCFPPRAGIQSAPPKHDPAAARTLLAELVKVPSIRLELASDSQASERAGAAIKEMLGAVGLTLELEPRPFRVLMDSMRKRTQATLTLYAWRLPPDWDAAPILETGADRNFTGISDPELDAALRRARTSRGPDRKRALAEVERRYRELVPTVSLLFRRSASLRPRWLEGWRPTGTTTPVTWNAEAWRVRGRSDSDSVGSAKEDLRTSPAPSGSKR